MRRRPAPCRGNASGRERFERQRRGGLVIVERAPRDLRIKILGHHIKTLQRAGGLHRLELFLQPVGATDRLRHVLAALARQGIAVRFELSDAL
jgi:hypothetical protein